MARPFFLLCNDDGVHAPGIKALAEVAGKLGDLLIVAPHVERSASGQALTLHWPLRCEKLDTDIYAIEGSPADCVLFALRKLTDKVPDLVLSGINRGANVGQDTLYSGTVAAAMEASLVNIPAMAFSLKSVVKDEFSEYQHAQTICAHLINQTALWKSMAGRVLNINIPAIPVKQMQGFAACSLGRRIYDIDLRECVDPRGKPYFWLGGGGGGFEDIAGSDCVALDKGFVTLSVLKPDHHDLATSKKVETLINNRQLPWPD
jgi:5'-nucleotidase